MNKHTELKKEEWKNTIADQRTTDRSNYPAAPSAAPGILKKYEELIDKAIEGKTEFRALVLGATPELRDMVLERGGKLTTLDISRDMIKKTSPLMKHQGHANETIVEGSWLASQLKDNSFDVILGDGVSANIAFKDQDNFFAELNRLLDLDGHLILREIAIDKDRPCQKVEEINQEFLDSTIHWFDMFFNLYFYSDISGLCHDGHDYYMDRLFDQIKKLHSENRLSKKAYDAMWWFKGNLKHTFLPEDIIKAFLAKYFETLPIEQAIDYNYVKDSYIFFFLKPKK